MYGLLLALIYLAFISLGLPDSLLGSGWPVMHGQLGVPVSFMGIVSMVISGGTIISSLLSDKLTRKLGTRVVTVVSVFLTVIALFGFSFSDKFWMLIIFAIPYGLGAGAIDAALNNYVALHYKSRHMSWLHCFWGVGCSVSPYIMGYALTGHSSWSLGFRIVSVLQIILAAALFLSLPLWKKAAAAKTNSSLLPDDTETGSTAGKPLSIARMLQIKGVPLVLATFWAYCALESTTGIWASSYLVQHRGIDAETAAMFASLFYLGITFGRFLCGFVADKLGDNRLIHIGTLTAIAGAALILLPLPIDLPALGGLIIIGLGCAPIYPSIIHSTPANFGAENSQAIIGVQMASAYLGSTFMPPLFGLLATHVSIGLYPVYLLLFGGLMLLAWKRLRSSGPAPVH